MGYHQAGFEVVGVDNKPQPRYPFEFHQADALEFPLEGFDAYHASPPCQAYTVASRCNPKMNGTYPELVDDCRQRLIETGKPFVIENVPGSPLENPLILCGTMFGLKIRRHRLFEIEPPLFFAPASCSCRNGKTETRRHSVSSFGNGSRLITIHGHDFLVAEARQAMGIDWMVQKELSQAIPPAYTEYIGSHILETIAAKRKTQSVFDLAGVCQ